MSQVYSQSIGTFKEVGELKGLACFFIECLLAFIKQTCILNSSTNLSVSSDWIYNDFKGKYKIALRQIYWEEYQWFILCYPSQKAYRSPWVIKSPGHKADNFSPDWIRMSAVGSVQLLGAYWNVRRWWRVLMPGSIGHGTKWESLVLSCMPDSAG